MKKKRWWYVPVFLLAFLGCFILQLHLTEAGELEEISDEIGKINERRAKTNDRIAALEQKKMDALSYVEGIDEESARIADELEILETELEEAEEKKEELKEEKLRLRKELDGQYETMKARIKYMYENGNQEYIELILRSGSFSEMLNRAEYVSKISQYDNDLLNEYIRKQELLMQTESKLEEHLEYLDRVKEEKEYNQKKLGELRKMKETEIAAYTEQIGKSKKEIKEYTRKIREQEKMFEELLEEERRKVEEEERRRGEDGEEPEEDGESSDMLFDWPLATKGTITGYFGHREIPIAGASADHNGLDIGVAQGTPILAAGSGTVTISRYSSTAGNYIMIYHGGSTYTVYMHALELLVEEGEEVHRGQMIAYVGSTGLSTGPHLHFGVHVGGMYVDPLDYVEMPE